MADSEQRLAPAATPSEPQSVGKMLQQARIARDLSLEQVSTELRIEARQLDALEQDRFEQIGVPVFVKGYIRQYGTRLGLDVRDLLAQYYNQSSLKEVQIQPSKTIKLTDERQITVWIVATLILAALVVALGFWLWNGGGFDLGAFTPEAQTSNEPSVPAAAPVAPLAPSAAAPSSPAAVETAAVAAPPDVVASPPDSASKASTVILLPVAASTEPAAVPEDSADERRSASVTAALQVTFEQESWAEITDARGKRLFYGLGVAGRNAKLGGELPFAVVLGNSAGVRIKLDGEEFPVPTTGKPGDSARFSVDSFED